MPTLKFTLVDCETTGVESHDKVCEVAYCEIDDAFNVIKTGSSLINPEVPIHYSASAINGITDAMVSSAPTLREYMAAQGEPLMQSNLVFVAHNSQFDYRFLRDHVSDTAVQLCTLKCARVLYPDAANHKQGTLAAMLGIQVAREKAHSADGDLDVLLQLLQCLCRDAGTDLYGLLEVQRRPRPIKNMPFGKHKGVPLADLPGNYIHWLLNKAENLDADLRTALLAL